PKSSGFELAQVAGDPVAAAHGGCRSLCHHAVVLSIGILLSRRRARFHFCAGGCRPQPSHGVRLTRPSGPRWLSSHLCLFRCDLSCSSWCAFWVVPVRRGGTLSCSCILCGSADSPAQGTLSRRRDSRFRIACCDRTDQRGGFDWWSRWHDRPQTLAFWLECAG